MGRKNNRQSIAYTGLRGQCLELRLVLLSFLKTTEGVLVKKWHRFSYLENNISSRSFPNLSTSFKFFLLTTECALIKSSLLKL